METGIIIGVIFIIVWIISREFHCWYWKVNHRNEILEQIQKQLSDLNTNLQSFLFKESSKK
jgi:hypothetical protein